MRNKEFQSRILLARSRSPFKVATLEDVNLHKGLTIWAKRFCQVLIENGTEVVLLTKERHALRVEVFGRFYPNEQITSQEELDYIIDAWGVGTREPHIINKRHYIMAIPVKDKVKLNEEYKEFTDMCLTRFSELLKSDKYIHLTRRCIKDGNINHEAVRMLIKWMKTNNEFFHPRFKIIFDGQDYDFLWYPTFKDSVTKTIVQIAI